MAIKITGAELKEFLGSDWKIKNLDWYLEWIEATVNGVAVEADGLNNDLADTDIIRVIDGTIIANEDPTVYESFVSAFKKWKKVKTTVTFSVECDKADYEVLVALIKDNKGMV